MVNVKLVTRGLISFAVTLLILGCSPVQFSASRTLKSTSQTGTETGATTGLTTGASTGESSGGSTGVTTTGSTSGGSTGATTTGSTSGGSTGGSTGETTSSTTGSTTGNSTGGVTGETTSSTTGGSTGETTGSTTGSTTGETTGSTTGTTGVINCGEHPDGSQWTVHTDDTRTDADPACQFGGKTRYFDTDVVYKCAAGNVSVVSQTETFDRSVGNCNCDGHAHNSIWTETIKEGASERGSCAGKTRIFDVEQDKICLDANISNQGNPRWVNPRETGSCTVFEESCHITNGSNPPTEDLFGPTSSKAGVCEIPSNANVLRANINLILDDGGWVWMTTADDPWDRAQWQQIHWESWIDDCALFDFNYDITTRVRPGKNYFGFKACNSVLYDGSSHEGEEDCSLSGSGSLEGYRYTVSGALRIRIEYTLP